MNIRVDLETPIADGTEVVFRSPVDCSQVTGLIVYYNGESKEFAFADAHGNNVGDIDHLFAENVVVKVILDLRTNMAFVQNADTNAYLEQRIDGVDLTLPHELTEAEKAQARANIGAAAVGEGGSVDLSNYYTRDEVDQKGYLTEAQLDGKGYLTESQLEGKCYQTEADVQALINTAIDNIPVWDGSFTKGVL